MIWLMYSKPICWKILVKMPILQLLCAIWYQIKSQMKISCHRLDIQLCVEKYLYFVVIGHFFLACLKKLPFSEVHPNEKAFAIFTFYLFKFHIVFCVRRKPNNVINWFFGKGWIVLTFSYFSKYIHTRNSGFISVTIYFNRARKPYKICSTIFDRWQYRDT